MSNNLYYYLRGQRIDFEEITDVYVMLPEQAPDFPDEESRKSTLQDARQNVANTSIRRMNSNQFDAMVFAGYSFVVTNQTATTPNSSSSEHELSGVPNASSTATIYRHQNGDHLLNTGRLCLQFESSLNEKTISARLEDPRFAKVESLPVGPDVFEIRLHDQSMIFNIIHELAEQNEIKWVV